ncbi:MAG: hypothetical protein EPN50_06650, partial [Chloroflexota bacterium]
MAGADAHRAAVPARDRRLPESRRSPSVRGRAVGGWTLDLRPSGPGQPARHAGAAVRLPASPLTPAGAPARLAAMASRDLYRILQVHPEADPDVIQAAYRRLARRRHPDAPGG